MSQLKPRTKHIDLRFLGEGWEDAYVDFRALSWAEIKQLRQKQGEGLTEDQAMDVLMQTLQDNFLAGRTLGTDNQPFDMTAADLADFDIETLTVFSDVLGGAPAPND
jgi:hypothetical protein